MEPISLTQGRLRGPILRLQSDERLARMAADGDDGAFEVLVKRHRPTLLRACRRVLSGSQVEDATQQALLSAHQALRRNGSPDRFEPWLQRIAFNAALKELQATPKELPLDDERLDGVEQPPDHLERRERLRDTVGAIGALPDRQRRALVLREMEGRSHDEIARDLGLSQGAVRQLIHRARTSVRSAVSALTPYGLLLRISADSDGPTRAAEIVAGGGAGAYVGKTLVAALVAGGIASGVAMVPEDGPPAKAAGEQTSPAAAESGTPAAGGDSGSGSDRDSRRENREGREGDDDVEDSSGHGGDDESQRSRRGSNSGSGSSGSGSGDDGREEDSSGSGSSGSGSGGSGSSGSGSSGSGSGSEVDDGRRGD